MDVKTWKGLRTAKTNVLEATGWLETCLIDTNDHKFMVEAIKRADDLLLEALGTLKALLDSAA